MGRIEIKCFRFGKETKSGAFVISFHYGDLIYIDSEVRRVLLGRGQDYMFLV